MTKKSKNPKSRSTSHNTGIALLFCFLVAAVAVSFSLRQLALERRHQSVTLSQEIASYVGLYTTTLAPNTPRAATLKLSLNSDNTAELVVTSPPLESQSYRGSWSGDSNGTIIVALPNNTFAFTYNQDTLRLLNPDANLWQATTASLTKTP